MLSSPRCLLGLLRTGPVYPILQSPVLLSLLPTSFRHFRYVFISGSSARGAAGLARVASAAQAPEHRAQVAGQHAMAWSRLEEGLGTRQEPGMCTVPLVGQDDEHFPMGSARADASPIV